MFSLTRMTMNLAIRSSYINESSFHTSAALERARRGTRDRKRRAVLKAIKVKAERLRKNPPPIPQKVELMLKSKGLWGPPKALREKDQDLPFPIDNVYFAKDYAYKRYTIAEAVDNLKLLCHPSMMNEPDALVFVKIEFDMRANKRDRYIDSFTKTAPIVRPYERNVPDRQVACFVPNEELRLQALQEGAVMAGGADLVMDISRGRVDIVSSSIFCICKTSLLFLTFIGGN